MAAEKKSGTETDSNKEAPTDWWGAGNTALLTIFTGSLAWLAHRQWQAMEKQAGYMRDALLETKKAADAAKASAESLISIERAWMDITDLVEGERANPPNGFIFNIRNNGKTPARLTDLRVVCKTLSPDHQLPDDPDYGPAKVRWIGGDQGYEPMLLPGGKFPSLIHLPFPEDPGWEAIYTEQVRIYAYGVLQYIDSFERARVLRFGFQYLPAKPNKRRSQWVRIPSKEYNQQS